MQTAKSPSLSSASFTFGDSQTKKKQQQSGILLQTLVPVHGMQNEGVENLHNDDIFEVGEDLIPLKQAMDDCAFKDRVSTLILCDGWVDEK